MEINNLSLPQLAQALDDKRISSVEITQHYIERIAKHDGDIKSYLHVAQEHALKAAHRQDELRAKNQAKPGAGIPIALKDNLVTKDMPTTCASKMLDGFYSPYNATVVDNLEDAGFVILGKLNMDEFAMGSSGETSYFKKTVNPWDFSKVPGGSSSGSAACVAAGLSPAALGSDTGGSIRQPASFCGVVGYKPTYGLVSRYGAVAYASSMDQVGPVCSSVEDAAYLMDRIAVYDPKDPTCAPCADRSFYKYLDGNIKGVRLGIPSNYFTEHVNEDVKKAVMQAVDTMVSLGAELVDVELPHAHMGLAAYQVLANGEVSSGLARFDGIEFGYSSGASDLNSLYIQNRSVFGREVKKRQIHGTYALQKAQYESYYIKAAKVRRLISEDYAKAFEKCDLLAGPTVSTVAFNFGGVGLNALEMALNDLYTVTLNLYGGCGISLPCGFTSGLPVGLQLQGGMFADRRLLNVAFAYQQATQWHKKYCKVRG